jgi:GTP 3',8-cyclase
VLLDTLGRIATDLRVSLTDRCNLRCTYCMPAEGLPWLPKDELLSDDEIVRLIAVAVSQGVTEVRFTGGEPLVRPGLEGIIARIAALDSRPRMSLTTNGIGLAQRAVGLREAGLDRVNVSLDTVDRETFKAITRRDRFDDVVAGLAAADAAGLRPVKVNAVLLRDVNETKPGALLRWCLDRGYELRFIEQMPLDPQHGWNRDQMITADEILAELEQEFSLTPEGDDVRGSAPSETWVVDGGPGRVGVIGSVTRPFCAACDRVRLTADGQVRNCLFAQDEGDLRTPLRSGATDEDLAEIMRATLWAKRPGHGIGEPLFLQPTRPMSAIGG